MAKGGRSGSGGGGGMKTAGAYESPGQSQALTMSDIAQDGGTVINQRGDGTMFVSGNQSIHASNDLGDFTRNINYLVDNGFATKSRVGKSKLGNRYEIKITDKGKLALKDLGLRGK